MAGVPQERWAEVERLLDQALALAPEERPAFLERACVGDRGLQAEVERLLRAADGVENFLEEPGAAYAAPLLAYVVERRALAPGARVGNYEVVRELGRGGMATVYLAHDLKHRREVALKVLPPDLALAVRTERFLREIEIAARLTHPNILPVFDSGSAGGLLYYVTPYIEGESLQQRLERAGPLPLEEALRLAEEVAGALDYAHRHAVVHRDIKPANILIADGHAVVADFGIARAITVAESEAITARGASPGTPTYMSPEQAGGHAELDGRSDQYSLGCVLYEMLTGAPPFTGSDAQAVLARHLTEPAPSVSAKRADVPSNVEGALASALAKLPAERFGTAAGFAAALAGEHLPGRPSRRRPRPVVALLFGVPLLVVGAAAIVRWLIHPAIPSIAVPPIINMTGDTANDYLGDGLTEEVISALVQAGGMRVPSLTSSFAYKGKGMTAREFARALDVDYALDWGLRRVGDQLHITAQLVKASDGFPVWSNRYDQTLEGVLDIPKTRQELARRIATALRAKLAPGGFAALARRHSRTPEAYDLYLRGRESWRTVTREALLKAIDFFQRAIALDSGYALAYSGLSDAYLRAGGNGFLPWEQAYAKAKVAALNAVAFGDSLVEVHVSLARAYQIYDWDWKGAEREYRRAIEINPRYAMAHSWYGVLLAGVMSVEGRAEEGIRETRLGLELDPQSDMASFVHGLALYAGRHYDQAIASLRNAAALRPEWSSPRIGLAAAFGRKGEYAQALAEVDTARRLNAAVASTYANIGYIYARTGRREEALAILRDLRGRSGTSGTWRAVAAVYAGLGDREATLAALDSAVTHHDFVMVGPDLGDGVWDSVRADPRFDRILERAGLGN